MKNLNLPENSHDLQQQEILDALPVLVFLERGGELVFANREARHSLGMGDAEWVSRPVEDVLWGLSAGTAEPQTHLVGTRAGSAFHATLPTCSGQLLSVEGTYSILHSDRHEAIVVAHPTGTVRTPKSQLMEDVLASIPEAVVIVHSDHVLYTNPAFTQMFGYTGEEASGANLCELIVPDTRHDEPAMLAKEVDSTGRASMETVRRTKSGDLVEVALVAGPLQVHGSNVGYVLSFRDIGERKRAEFKLHQNALFDSASGLPTGGLFLDRLARVLSRTARRSGQHCAVLMLDLDGFRELNQSLGPAACDVLIRGVAERLRLFLRPEDSPSRISGDEFAILVEDLIDEEDLHSIASRVLDLVSQPIDVFGKIIRVTASMGAAMATTDHICGELLVRDAEAAMRRARLNGGNCLEVFKKGPESASRKRLHTLAGELKNVLQRRRYEVWYQPIYRLKGGTLEGFESLLRLRRRDGSVDSFRHMLALAEDSGLSITLGRETMDTVCRQLRNWSENLAQRELTLSLNLTERQFYHPDMVPQLKKALEANGVDPSLLLFEVAEITLSRNQDAAALTLKQMSECGVRIAVDNFGARYAPLNHLAELPIDVVKLAPKLTAGATIAGRPSAVVDSLVHLGHALGMQVVAQGIETPEQLTALGNMGCELGQGHLFSYAIDPARATVLAGAGRWSLAPGA